MKTIIQGRRHRSRTAQGLWAVSLGALVFLYACGSVQTVEEGSAEDAAANRVADLQIVDCLLPGQVRQLGQMRYLSARRPIKTTAADCRIRGGEYTAYDRASMKTALAVWMPAAQAGDVEAMANVGEIFERGLGESANYQAAALWYRKAAEAGNSRAQFNLGTLYEQGLGVAVDKAAALNWYRKAWGMEEDNVIFQSAAQRELEARIGERDERIARLQRGMGRLQQQLSAAANQDETEALRQEIDELRRYIGSLEDERAAAAAQLAAAPAGDVSSESAAVSDSPQIAGVLPTQPAGDVSAPDSPPRPRVRAPTATTTATSNLLSAGSAEQIRAMGLEFGRYFALVIGNQQYSKIEPLQTPRNDAVNIADLLRDKYGFNVTVLLDATNIEVMEAINDLNQTLTDEDNLLIYYAGHGERIQAGELLSGYWLPVNADAPPRDTFWVSNEFVTGHLARLSARRVLVMADSCYAGLLSSSPGYLMLRDAPQYDAEFLRYKLPKRSRLLLSSGGDRPVLDEGAPNHSVFAATVLNTLRDNERILSGPQLFQAIDGKIRERAADMGFEQRAEYKAIKGAGHEVGDFFFVPTSSG